MATVLIADNDLQVRALLAEVARRTGFAVTTADDGEAARALLSAGTFDLFVCDLDMPRLSGPQLLQWLAARPSAPAVVVVSGFLDARLEAELGALPCVRTMLRKPFDVLQFMDLLRGFAAAAGSGRAAATADRSVAAPDRVADRVRPAEAPAGSATGLPAGLPTGSSTGSPAGSTTGPATGPPGGLAGGSTGAPPGAAGAAEP